MKMVYISIRNSGSLWKFRDESYHKPISSLHPGLKYASEAEIHRKSGENYNAMWIARFGYILPTDSTIIKKSL